ncbi:MAG: phosphohydrolase [Hyphomicrobiales bacterium]|nr:MAG: phosphohydrolase [Hyphomicrobiales bacterium]
MKILVVSDFHYALPQFDWLVGAAPAYDLVIFAGDLLDTNSLVDPGTQIVVVMKYLKRISELTRLIVCSGNHDLDAIGADGEKHAQWLGAARRLSIPVDGDTLEIGDTLITICPWWDGPLTQQAIARQFEAAAPRRKGAWLWVYHAPPSDTPIAWSGQRHFGDAALSGWIAQYRPDFVISGHVHEAPFARNGSWADRLGDSWLFNPGRQIGETPTTIAIDTSAMEAAWFSLEGAELVKLDAPLERPLAQLMALPGWMQRAPA